MHIGPLTTVQVEHADAVAVVRLNRPDRRNAIDTVMKRELREVWSVIAASSTVRAVIMTGSGTVFSAGADRQDLDSIEMQEVPAAPGVDYGPTTVVRVPVIAAVNGACIGGALRLVADADIAIAARSAWFSDPHVAHGLSSGPMIGELSAVMSRAAVSLLSLGGQAVRLNAEDARSAGLVAEVVEDGELMKRAHLLADAIASCPSTAVGETLELLRAHRMSQVHPWIESGWAALSRSLAARTSIGESR